MRYATMFLGSLAPLFSAAVVLAQDPLTAALRDAQHLAECTKALNAHSSASLYDAASYELLNRQTGYPDPTKDLARYFDKLKRRGVRFTHFETLPPKEVFNDGVRLCCRRL